MKVNISVPVYNVAPYLEQFLDSLAAQTYQDFDVVAMDDGSTDGSREILERYRTIFEDRLKILTNRVSLGPGLTRNMCMDNLPEDGEYVLFLDSDDCLEPTYVEKLVRAAEESQADMVICGCDRFYGDLGQHTKGEMISNPENVVDITSKELTYMNTFLWNKLFRRELIGDTRFAEMKRWEDISFLFQVLPRVKRIRFVNEVLYHYRQRDDSLTGGLTDAEYEAALEGFQREAQTFQHHIEDYRQIKDAFEVQLFMRCAVGGVCRMSLKNMRNAHRYVRQMRAYLDETIPDWKRNPYLTLRGVRNRSWKENAIMIAALLYKLNLFPLFVWAYWIMKRVLKKDVRY